MSPLPGKTCPTRPFLHAGLTLESDNSGVGRFEDDRLDWFRLFAAGLTLLADALPPTVAPEVHLLSRAVQSTLGPKGGNAIIDVFKLENGKIVEHWDAFQSVIDNPANGNTLFGK